MRQFRALGQTVKDHRDGNPGPRDSIIGSNSVSVAAPRADTPNTFTAAENKSHPFASVAYSLPPPARLEPACYREIGRSCSPQFLQRFSSWPRSAAYHTRWKVSHRISESQASNRHYAGHPALPRSSKVRFKPLAVEDPRFIPDRMRTGGVLWAESGGVALKPRPPPQRLPIQSFPLARSVFCLRCLRAL